MAYWRMQLHPDDSGNSAFHSAQSLSAGFIGLDFAERVSDLEFEELDKIPQHQKDYVAFANQMKVGDKVLIISHHFPFAVCTVSGDYNYIKTPVPELGVWFRHFRRVDNVKYFADFKTNAKAWQQIKMTDTISPLVNEGTLSLNLIREMYPET
ncbi:hypothetical protein FR729_07585 [Vibrio alginolyticus]|uniref:hypothetical protein n=1 Tax=Vibrio alginolyticus TaxID=663 RepID=UPI0014283842|nr:hypothetical protein [Vibrio alginolyticus]QIR92975.1 hypothetical protein FR729_07585 [Vibrio alginolyticus]